MDQDSTMDVDEMFHLAGCFQYQLRFSFFFSYIGAAAAEELDFTQKMESWLIHWIRSQELYPVYRQNMLRAQIWTHMMGFFLIAFLFTLYVSLTSA